MKVLVLEGCSAFSYILLWIPQAAGNAERDSKLPTTQISFTAPGCVWDGELPSPKSEILPHGISRNHKALRPAKSDLSIFTSCPSCAVSLYSYNLQEHLRRGVEILCSSVT